jgi:hypothetical protein
VHWLLVYDLCRCLYARIPASCRPKVPSAGSSAGVFEDVYNDGEFAIIDKAREIAVNIHLSSFHGEGPSDIP